MSTRPKLIVILGPTASGKTKLAIKLAKSALGGKGEVVSADSRQIYRGMDIGTAKATPQEQKQVKHYLIDIKNPNQTYTLAQYKTDALHTIRKILKRGKIPLLVGGTGLYISAIVNNLEVPKVKPNKILRRKLERQMKKYGLNYLYGKLTTLDQEASYLIDPKNPRRVIRALEVAMSTGKPFTLQRKIGKPLFDCLILGIALPKAKLRKRIANRAEAMIKKGLISEVKTLLKKYGPRRTPFDAIGYREIIKYLQGELTLDEALKLMNKNSWNFVRHQLNWFKRLPVLWIRNQKDAERKIEKFLINNLPH